VKLVLHNYWRSSASHRVRIGLQLKGLAYDYVAVNITNKGGEQQRTDAYRAKNPMMQVPTLEVIEDDGSVHMLAQSLPILEFLEERFPQTAILPKDPYARAKVRTLAEIVNSGIQPLQNIATTNKVAALGGDEAAWRVEFVGNGLAAFARTLGDSIDKFCVGGSPTIADCCLIPQLASARRFGVPLGPGHAQLLAIEERCLAIPAFVAAAPENQPDASRA
jgi:maleylacetoacetate isomerase